MPLVNEAKPTVIHQVLILDESGSMGNVKDATVNGYNEMLDHIRDLAVSNPNVTYKVTLTTFNSSVDIKLVGESLERLGKLGMHEYNPRAMTALYDAVGMTIERLDSVVKRGEGVFITVFTDGEENASQKYEEGVSKLVSGRKEQGWVFTLIGANGSVLEAANLGVTRGNTLQYTADSVGTRSAFVSLAMAQASYTKSIQVNGLEYAASQDWMAPPTCDISSDDDINRDDIITGTIDSNMDGVVDALLNGGDS